LGEQANIPRSWSDEPVHIAHYDATWPERFERERAMLQEAIGEWVAGGVHHIGSTSVPGLDAKPIIDILVGVGDLELPPECFARLAALDYVHAPYRIGEMHWFAKPDPLHRTHHLHLVAVDSPRFGDSLLFRDQLRARPEVARDYVALKHHLAEVFKHDRDSYTQAKGEFICSTVRQAQEQGRKPALRPASAPAHAPAPAHALSA